MFSIIFDIAIVVCFIGASVSITLKQEQEFSRNLRRGSTVNLDVPDLAQ
ncbi:MAG: hypothetical protein HC840_09625 [Leptolyngbyaceae cyanobacterium RM2_2_4]|nr:hypothetical protein [Leptolyngbyaceae cyanobacterium SM1_4_3]NJO49648.1 hypothetical protein [Leptolyngbyaceae cyanobacterium RM2_2_4]